MQTTTKVAATGGAALAACAACCAVGIAPAVLAGPGITAVGGTVAAWGVPALLLAVPVGAYLMMRKRRGTAETTSTPVRIASQSSCVCGPSCASPKEEAPIACTLEAGDFKARAESIRELARRSLLKSSREPLALRLLYASEAEDEVADLVRKEQACCAFLDFDLRRQVDGVHLTITAPVTAAEAADMLFDHFAPELAGNTTGRVAA